MIVWCALGWAAPSAVELSSSWDALQPHVAKHGTFPLAFTEQDWQRVAEGKVARRRERLDGADRVVGMVWVDADQHLTWLTVQDPHGSTVKGMVDEELAGSTAAHRLLFQKIDLPWPLASRQWVIEVVNNQPLADATSGAYWERTWRLSDERGAAAEDPKAVWLPVNDGGWAYVRVGGGTLLVYHVRSVVGGNVPDDMATHWSFSTLTGMLEGIRDRVPWERGHYTAAHAPIRSPDGAVLPPLAP